MAKEKLLVQIRMKENLKMGFPTAMAYIHGAIKMYLKGNLLKVFARDEVK